MQLRARRLSLASGATNSAHSLVADKLDLNDAQFNPPYSASLPVCPQLRSSRALAGNFLITKPAVPNDFGLRSLVVALTCQASRDGNKPATKC